MKIFIHKKTRLKVDYIYKVQRGFMYVDKKGIQRYLRTVHYRFKVHEPILILLSDINVIEYKETDWEEYRGEIK